MTLTSAFCGPASTAASSPPDPPPGGLCAIHQPNLFPRLSTLAKLYAADRWIVLDDVQFARRDYQHRARLADLAEPARQQWLTLPTHLPQGRSTLISQARLVDSQRSRRTVHLLVHQYYGRSPHWKAVSDVVDAVLDTLDTSDRLDDVATASTIALLTVLGWSGTVSASSEIPTRPGRSERLVDLAAATGSTHYLCGTGGLRYLDAAPFDAHGIPVLPFHTPVDDFLWLWARRASSLWALSAVGPGELASQLAVLGPRPFTKETPVTPAAARKGRRAHRNGSDDRLRGPGLPLT